MRTALIWLLDRLDPRTNGPKWGAALGAFVAPWLADRLAAVGLVVPPDFKTTVALVATALIGAGFGWVVQKLSTNPRRTSIDEASLMSATDNSVKPEDGPQVLDDGTVLATETLDELP